MDNNIFLSSEKLDTLTNRVAKKIEFLKLMNRQNMWDKPIEYCKQIEQSRMAVDTVVLTAMEEKGHFQTSSSYPYNYQMMMVRIYILLYYRHCGDALYNTIVFPAIKDKMGVFRDRYLNDINSKLDEVLKMEELIKKAKQDSQKDLKPKFSLIRISKGESDELFDEYNEERLFRCLTPELEYIGKKHMMIIDAAKMWRNAKETVRKLWQVKYPESYIKRILSTQYIELEQADAPDPQIIMMCVYAMMRSVKKSDHFKDAIAEVERFYSNYGSVQHTLLFEHMKEWKEIFDRKDVFDDYDYVGEEPTKDTFTSADIVRLQQRFEQQTEDLNQQLKEKDDKIAELERQIKETTAADDEDGLPVSDENKPRLLTLLKLMEKDGFDLEAKGIKKKTLAALMEYITGIPKKSCQNFCSDTHVDREHHREAITFVNGKFQDLGMSIRL